jgi:hypothetical protein
MTLDKAIKHEEEVVKEQEELYRLCPASESIFHCDGTTDCKTLQNGKNKGCQKCAEEHRQLAEWLKELKAHREAWGKVKRTLKAYLMLEEFGSAYQDDIEKLIEGCIPKEGENE